LFVGLGIVRAGVEVLADDVVADPRQSCLGIVVAAPDPMRARMSRAVATWRTTVWRFVQLLRLSDRSRERCGREIRLQ
jgi:hypothetical protein